MSVDNSNLSPPVQSNALDENLVQTDTTINNLDIISSIQVYLGGSFDPIHNSHIAMLTHVYYQLAMDTSVTNVQAYFMPTPRSPLKKKSTEPQHRLNMLKLAISQLIKKLEPQHRSAFKISEYEIWQTPPTYTIDTLRYLRQITPTDSLVFIVGADNIASLSKWRDADKLIDYAHLWVIPRDQLQSKQAIADLLPEKLKSAVVSSSTDLKYATHGCIYIDSYSVKPISSSGIRDALTQAQTDIVKSTLPHPVYSYIMKNNLYDAN